jgi:hypothetical protein
MNTLFFGSNQSKSKNIEPKINFIKSGKSNVFFSRSNYNLFLNPKETKYISLGTILYKSNHPSRLEKEAIFRDFPNACFAQQVCIECAKTTLGCPLIVKEVVEDELKYGDERYRFNWWVLKDRLEIDAWQISCPFLKSYVDLTQTPQERKFLQLYLDSAVRGFNFYLIDGISDYASTFMEEIVDHIPKILTSEPISRFTKGKSTIVPHTIALIGVDKDDRFQLNKPALDNSHYETIYLEQLDAIISKEMKNKRNIRIGTACNLTISEVFQLGEWLRRSLFCIPAMIPQVWLQYVNKVNGKKKSVNSKNAYSNVDFMEIWYGKEFVFEIDGVVHYSIYDRNKKQWVPSEDEYTKNLQRERYLRQHGYIFFRTSNQEIESANSWGEIEKTIGLDLIDTELMLDYDPDSPEEYLSYF